MIHMWNELPKKSELSFGALHLWNKLCKQAQWSVLEERWHEHSWGAQNCGVAVSVRIRNWKFQISLTFMLHIVSKYCKSLNIITSENFSIWFKSTKIELRDDQHCNRAANEQAWRRGTQSLQSREKKPNQKWRRGLISGNSHTHIQRPSTAME